MAERKVARDLARARRRNLKALRQNRAPAQWLVENAMQALQEVDAVMRQAWADCLAAPEGSNTRAGFLNVLLHGFGRREGILRSLWLSEKALGRMQLDARTAVFGAMAELARERVLGMALARARQLLADGDAQESMRWLRN